MYRVRGKGISSHLQADDRLRDELGQRGHDVALVERPRLRDAIALGLGLGVGPRLRDAIALRLGLGLGLGPRLRDAIALGLGLGLGLGPRLRDAIAGVAHEVGGPVQQRLAHGRLHDRQQVGEVRRGLVLHGLRRRRGEARDRREQPSDEAGEARVSHLG